jgi:hypothetical protein
MDLPLRASNEGLLRPRIERAHSYRARSASKKGIWLLPISSAAVQDRPLEANDELLAFARPGTLLRIAGQTFALPPIALSAIYEQWEMPA